MLRRFTLFAAAVLFSTAAHAAKVGEPAPTFNGMDVLSGKTVSNTSLKGKTVVLEWNNPDCPFVHKFYDSGTMQKLQAAAIKDGVVWVVINSSAVGKEGHLKDAAAVKAILTERASAPSHYLIDADGTIGKAYGAKTTPHMYVIYAEGKLVYQGAIDDKPTPDSADIASAHNYVTAALAEIKAGKPVSKASTQAYGCFVKY